MNIKLSHGSVATDFRRGGVLHSHVFRTLFLNTTSKELLSWSNGQLVQKCQIMMKITLVFFALPSSIQPECVPNKVY